MLSHTHCYVAVEGPVSISPSLMRGLSLATGIYCGYAYALLTAMLAKERKRKLRSLRFFADGRSLANLVSGVFFLWGSLGY